MNRFLALYESLDRTVSTNAKVEALRTYFALVPRDDAAWALYFLSGRRLKRLLPTALLWEWTLELTGLPPWLLEESYSSVGDLAETIALVVDAHERVSADDGDGDVPLARWIEDRIVPLRGMDPVEQRRLVIGWWATRPREEIFLLNKLLTGEFRVGVSQTLVVRAVAQLAGLPQPVIAHRLMGTWAPTAPFFDGLLAPEGEDSDRSRPYPFYLASPLDGSVEELGDRGDWLAEWKWDGIRAQIVKRAGEIYIWSRGEELVTDRFPELVRAVAALPSGTVIDGEVLAYKDDAPLPFARLQRRIGRQKLTPAVLADAPVALIAYDLLEQDGQDIRALPLADRRQRLERLTQGVSAALTISTNVDAPSWDGLREARGEARSRGVEGLMLKRLSSPYGTGRRRGDWWKWKIDPHTMDAVLVYAQPGSGRRANLLTDYTFALWDQDTLVPVAKAYSGLSKEEIAELDRWIRSHTTERFGPVRAVEPHHVFELAFEAIARSSRHRSGIAVRFPRIARWRHDKTPKDADRLDDVKGLLQC